MSTDIPPSSKGGKKLTQEKIGKEKAKPVKPWTLVCDLESLRVSSDCTSPLREVPTGSLFEVPDQLLPREERLLERDTGVQGQAACANPILPVRLKVVCAAQDCLKARQQEIKKERDRIFWGGSPTK